MIGLDEILAIVRADETREIVHCVGITLAALMLGIPALCFVVKKLRARFGLVMLGIAACFLHSMANKANISLKSESATNLVFHCDCNTNLVGEMAYFTYSKYDSDGIWYIIAPTFFVPSTNFDHTVNGCYIGGGKDRKFKLIVEKESSNEVVR